MFRSTHTSLGQAPSRRRGDRGLYDKVVLTEEEKVSLAQDVERNKRSMIDSGKVDPVTGQPTILSQYDSIYWRQNPNDARDFALQNAAEFNKHPVGAALVQAAQQSLASGLPMKRPGGFFSGNLFGVPRVLVFGVGGALAFVFGYKFFKKS